MTGVSFVLTCSGVLGALTGSFLTVVIARLPRQCQSIAKPRSHCEHCLTTIAWHDNIPMLSWVALGGRCRRCRARIGLSPLLIEALTTLIFLLIAHRLVTHQGMALPAGASGYLEGLVWAAFASSLVAAAGIDLKLAIIPDEISMGGAFLAPLCAFALPGLHEHALRGDFFADARVQALLEALYGMLVGAGVLFLLGASGKAVFRKEAMGWGDIKLLAFIGGMLGWQGTLVAILLAAFSGAIIGVARELVTRARMAKSRPSLPAPDSSASWGAVDALAERQAPASSPVGLAPITFGAHLAFGAIVVVLFRDEIFHFLFDTYPRLVLGG